MKLGLFFFLSSFTGLPVGGDVEVCVSAVDSPNLFYLQLIATEAK